MKSWAWVLAAMLGAGAARADLIGTYKAITLDGSLSDWTAADLMYDDSAITDGDPANSSYANIYVANDATYLYLALETKGSGGADINNSYMREVYIDADMDGGTGFDAGWMTGGYDNLVQYGAGGGSYSVFAHAGGDQTAWSWNWQSLISYSYNGSFIELAVPLSALGLSPGDSARLEFHVTGTGVASETWASDPESSVGTYTLGVVPEPASLGLIGIGALVVVFARRRFA